MQMHGSVHRTVVSTARSVYKAEGLRAFYVSYPTTLTMTVPFTAVQFSIYEWAKKVLNPSESYSPISHAAAGGFSGAVAAAVTNPLDVAKTLLQTRGGSSDMEIKNANGMIEAMKIIHRREGMKGFARGLTPRVLTFMPSNALCWLVSNCIEESYLHHLFEEGSLLTHLELLSPSSPFSVVRRIPFLPTQRKEKRAGVECYSPHHSSVLLGRKTSKLKTRNHRPLTLPSILLTTL